MPKARTKNGTAWTTQGRAQSLDPTTGEWVTPEWLTLTDGDADLSATVRPRGDGWYLDRVFMEWPEGDGRRRQVGIPVEVITPDRAAAEAVILRVADEMRDMRASPFYGSLLDLEARAARRLDSVREMVGAKAVEAALGQL